MEKKKSVSVISAPMDDLQRVCVDLNKYPIEWFYMMNNAGLEFTVDGDSHAVCVAKQQEENPLNAKVLLTKNKARYDASVVMPEGLVIRLETARPDKS